MDGDTMQYLTFTELRAKLGNRSRSAIYVDLAAGRLPKPIKLGGKLYWPEGDIDAHLRGLREKAA
jgi:prophage regulatory protein